MVGNTHPPLPFPLLWSFERLWPDLRLASVGLMVPFLTVLSMVASVMLLRPVLFVLVTALVVPLVPLVLLVLPLILIHALCVVVMGLVPILVPTPVDTTTAALRLMIPVRRQEDLSGLLCLILTQHTTSRS